MITVSKNDEHNFQTDTHFWIKTKFIGNLIEAQELETKTKSFGRYQKKMGFHAVYSPTKFLFNLIVIANLFWPFNAQLFLFSCIFQDESR